MDLMVKVLLFILLALVLLSLGRAMFFLARDDGQQDRTRMVRALTMRIALSLLVFGLLFVGYWFGLLEPHAR